MQAEDELAAINMALGAAFGGIPSLTATSGPGLALMSESLGLGVAAEVPVCVINVQRGGPSTGIPTKSEQADLDIALHGLHGDAPHLVLAPLGIADCVFTTGWAVQLCQQLQTPGIVLSDQFTGQSTAIVSPPRQSGSIDAPVDAGPPDAPPFATGTFEAPLLVGELSTTMFNEDDPTLTGDMLEIYLKSRRGGNTDIFFATRASLEEDWSAPIRNDELSSAARMGLRKT